MGIVNINRCAAVGGPGQLQAPFGPFECPGVSDDFFRFSAQNSGHSQGAENVHCLKFSGQRNKNFHFFAEINQLKPLPVMLRERLYQTKLPAVVPVGDDLFPLSRQAFQSAENLNVGIKDGGSARNQDFTEQNQLGVEIISKVL